MHATPHARCDSCPALPAVNSLDLHTNATLDRLSRMNRLPLPARLDRPTRSLPDGSPARPIAYPNPPRLPVPVCLNRLSRPDPVPSRRLHNRLPRPTPIALSARSDRPSRPA